MHMNRLLFVLVELGTAVQVIDLFCTAGIFESFVESEAMAPHEKSKVDKGAHVLEEKNSQSATFCPGHAVGWVSAWRTTLLAVLRRGMPVAPPDGSCHFSPSATIKRGS